MFDRAGHDEIPIPIEGETGRVDVPVTGEISHGFCRVAVREAQPNGTPGVTAEVHAFFPVQPGEVGIRELVEDPVHDIRVIPGRNERALAGAVRPDLVKPHDEPAGRCNPERHGRGRAGRIRQAPRQQVRAVREVLHAPRAEQSAPQQEGRQQRGQRPDQRPQEQEKKRPDPPQLLFDRVESHVRRLELSGEFRNRRLELRGLFRCRCPDQRRELGDDGLSCHGFDFPHRSIDLPRIAFGRFSWGLQPGRVARTAAQLPLARRSVIGAGFALPRDAGRRPAFQAVPAISFVGGPAQRYPVRGCVTPYAGPSARSPCWVLEATRTPAAQRCSSVFSSTVGPKYQSFWMRSGLGPARNSRGGSGQPLSRRVVSSVVNVPTSVPNSRKRNVQIRPNCFSTESSLAFVVWS